MATVTPVHGGLRDVPMEMIIATNVTGNVDSDVADRGRYVTNEAMLIVTTTVGAGPTTKLDIKGSANGTNFHNISYALVATPETWTQAQITISTADTFSYIIKGGQAVRYVKFALSSNTNVTVTTAKLIAF